MLRFINSASVVGLIEANHLSPTGALPIHQVYPLDIFGISVQCAESWADNA
jgi:hypothetical protein